EILQLDLDLGLAVVEVGLAVITDITFSLQHVQNTGTQTRSGRGNGVLLAAVGITDTGQHIAERIAQGHLVYSLPARLDQARDLARIAQIAQRDTRNLEFAIIGARTAGDFTTVANADLG